MPVADESMGGFGVNESLKRKRRRLGRRDGLLLAVDRPIWTAFMKEEFGRRLTANDRRYGFVHQAFSSIFPTAPSCRVYYPETISAQEKHQAMERRLQELSEKVISLEQERDQLLRAVDSATGDSEVECPAILPLVGVPKLVILFASLLLRLG